MICYLTDAEYWGNSNLKAGRDLKDHCFKGEEISNLPPLQPTTHTSLRARALPRLTKEKTERPDVTGDSECVPQAEREGTLCYYPGNIFSEKQCKWVRKGPVDTSQLTSHCPRGLKVWHKCFLENSVPSSRLSISGPFIVHFWWHFWAFPHERNYNRKGCPGERVRRFIAEAWWAANPTVHSPRFLR